MKSLLYKNHRIAFYSCWVLLGLIQCRYTELLDDEAYYWVYSKFPAWGYFDHPPMVAILIRIGYFFFKSELGVRLMFLAFNLFSLIIMEKLTARKSPLLFYSIALSLAVLQLGGFLAVPDTPLIFFTAALFLCYRNFLIKATLFNTILFALVAAALLYSKYHAVLIIFFVILSNLKLLTRYQVYVAGIIALLCFVPHLWWQYQHDWISFKYHLFESNVNPYKFSYTLEFIGGQILLTGPLAGIIVLLAAFLYRPASNKKSMLKMNTSSGVFAVQKVERGLKFTLIGIYIFFFLSSFRGKVEANWTSPAIVPLFVLGHNFLSEARTPLALGLRKWFYRLLPATMVLVLFARIVMIADILPMKNFKTRYHGWEKWPAVMKQNTNGLPIVFGNSYQRASKYWFYSGQPAYSLNSYKERRNNYNFWPIEDSFLGKSVYLLDIYFPDSFQTRLKTNIGFVGYKYDSAYSTFAKIKFQPAQSNIQLDEDSTLKIGINPVCPPHYLKYISAHPRLKLKTVLGVFNKYKWLRDLQVPIPLLQLVDHPNIISFKTHLPKGRYYLIFSIYHIGTLNATHNSSKIELQVK